MAVMAPLTMCLGWRCSRVMCLSSRHSWFCARCPSQGGLFNEGIATLSDCQLTSNSAGSVRDLFVDASSAGCVPTEHAPSTTILKVKALRLSNAHVPPLSPASCLLRWCDSNRYVATAAMDATWHSNLFIGLLAKRQHRNHQYHVSRRCGGDGAPHDVPRLAMLARDVFIFAALVVLYSLSSLTGWWSLQFRRGYYRS